LRIGNVYFNVILLHAVSLIAVVQKKKKKLIIIIGVYRRQRTPQFVSYLRAFLPFYFNLNGKLTVVFFFFTFRDQQRGALKFKMMASENMRIDGFFCKRDGQT